MLSQAILEAQNQGDCIPLVKGAKSRENRAIQLKETIRAYGEFEVDEG